MSMGNVNRRFILGAITAASTAAIAPLAAARTTPPDLRMAYAVSVGDGEDAAHVWSGNGAPGHPLIIQGHRFTEVPFITCECQQEEWRGLVRARGFVSVAALGALWPAASIAMKDGRPAHMHAVWFDANASGRIVHVEPILSGGVTQISLQSNGGGAQLALGLAGVAP